MPTAGHSVVSQPAARLALGVRASLDFSRRGGNGGRRAIVGVGVPRDGLILPGDVGDGVGGAVDDNLRAPDNAPVVGVGASTCGAGAPSLTLVL